MSIFKHSLFAASFASFAAAADVSLLGDSKLSGEIVAMSDDGTITLVSPVASEPLKVRSEKVLKVDFGAGGELSEIPDQRVRLINGDVLPVKIEYLDERVLRANSPYLGELEIPRTLLDSVQLGIVPEKTIFQGPTGFSGWDRDAQGSRNLAVSDGAFVASGQGTVSRDFELPDKFVIRFDLNWRSNPNLRFTFADPLKGTGERVDRYFLQFAGAGLEIKRESAANNRYTTIAQLSRKPDEYVGNEMRVEIRVDRTRARLHLYINGELEGRYTDPVPDIPMSSGISIASQAPEESGQSIGNIQIAEWDDRGDRHRTEDRGNLDEDSLIGRYGERFGGRVISISEGEEGLVYRFKSDFQKESIELPESEVSTIFFAGSGEDKAVEEFEGLVLRLRGKGELRVSGCEFIKDIVKIRHPLLGKIELDRRGVTLLERRTAPKAKTTRNE